MYYWILVTDIFRRSALVFIEKDVFMLFGSLLIYLEFYLWLVIFNEYIILFLF